MRTILKRAGWVALVLVLTASAAGLWKRDEIARLWAVNSLFDETRIVGNFLDMQSDWYPSRTSTLRKTFVWPRLHHPCGYNAG